MIENCLLTSGWTFSTSPGGPWEPVLLPHHWDLAGHKGLGRGFYRVALPAVARGAVLVLPGVDYRFRALVDGQPVGEGACPFLAHEVELPPGGEVLMLDVEAGVERSGLLERLLYSAMECPVHTRKRHVKGIHGNWDCKIIDMETSGLWETPVIKSPGPVEVVSASLVTREILGDRAECEVSGLVRVREAATEVVVSVSLVEAGIEAMVHLPGDPGVRRFRVPLVVPRPRLWWTWDQGDPALYTLRVEVAGHAMDFPAGIRTFEAPLLKRGSRHLSDLFDYVNLFAGLARGRPGLHRGKPGFLLNGRPVFLRGADYTPPVPAGLASGANLAHDVDLARQANLNFLRVHGTSGARAIYDACDRVGILIEQDMPLQWGYRVRGETRRIALEVVRQTARRLAPHPSVAIYAVHNEPTPSNYLFLDGALARAIKDEDPSRPTLRGSGYPGTDAHIYPGWYVGRVEWFERARFPFVSEFGAQAVPDADGIVPDLGPRATQWPLDRALWRNHCLQFRFMGSWLPPVSSLADLCEQSQHYQAALLAIGCEHFRRMRSPGVASFMLAAVNPAVTWDVVDHRRRLKKGYHALARSMAPLMASFSRYRVYFGPGEQVAGRVWIVNDLPTPARGRLTWRLADPVGRTISEGAAPFAVKAHGLARGPEVAGALGVDPGRYVLTLAMAGPDGTALGTNEAWFVVILPGVETGGGLPAR